MLYQRRLLAGFSIKDQLCRILRDEWDLFKRSFNGNHKREFSVMVSFWKIVRFKSWLIDLFDELVGPKYSKTDKE
jgi:hypothetical protein